MIITKTPLRISLVGGGSDMPEFYMASPGAVVSFAINKYVYVITNHKFDNRIRVSYGETTESVDKVDDIQHDLVRHALTLYHRSGIEVVSVADIPGRGTGLGSSSSFTVGLCAALAQERNGSMPSPVRLACEAFLVERNLANHPVGKQDIWAATYGGLHHYKFHPDGVEVTPICLPENKIYYVQKHMMLLYTGVTRDANAILKANSEHLLSKNIAYMDAMQEQAQLADDLLHDLQHGHVTNIGKFLHQSWQIKRKLNGTSTPEIDEMYAKACNAGALGGKLLGAGGGGFLLIWAHPNNHDKIVEATGLRKVPFWISEKGCEVIHGK